MTYFDRAGLKPRAPLSFRFACGLRMSCIRAGPALSARLPCFLVACGSNSPLVQVKRRPWDKHGRARVDSSQDCGPETVCNPNAGSVRCQAPYERYSASSDVPKIAALCDARRHFLKNRLSLPAIESCTYNLVDLARLLLYHKVNDWRDKALIDWSVRPGASGE